MEAKQNSHRYREAMRPLRILRFAAVILIALGASFFLGLPLIAALGALLIVLGFEFFLLGKFLKTAEDNTIHSVDSHGR